MNRSAKHTTHIALAGLLSLVLVATAAARPAEARPHKKHHGRPAAADVARLPSDLHYPPLADITMPTPQRFSLENGMQVLLLEDHELPLVTGRALIRTGSRLEPPDKTGLAQLTGAVMRSGGTERMPSRELDRVLENMAASVETSIGTTNASARMSSLAEDFDRVLAIFADVLRRPAFEEDKLAVAKTQVRAAIARQNDTPGQILRREFPELIFGAGSPYARSATYQTIDALSRQDLVAWHRRFFHPENVILGLTGDFDAKTVRAQIEKVFGDWARGTQPAPEPPSAQAHFEPGVYFIEKGDVNQANIAIGHLGIDRHNPDYFTVEVLNEVLGGGFASRLVSEVRTKKALAYGVGGGVESSFDHAGLFRIQMSTKAASTGAGVEALLTEARRMLSEPPTQEEVARAKESMLAAMVFTADSDAKILSRQLTYAYFGYPSDWLSQYQKAIAAVTPAQVAAAARTYIHPDQVAIMVIGPSTGTEPPLSSFGTVHRLDITIPEPATETVAFSEAGAAKGRTLIEQAVAATGGSALIDGLTGLRLEAENQVVTPQGTFDVKSVELTAYPDRKRVELTLPFGTMIQVLDGDNSWIKTPQGVQTMPSAMRKQAAQGLLRDYFNLLRQRHNTDFEAVAAGRAEVDGVELEQVQVKIGEDVIRLGIDGTNGRILTMTYHGTNNAGAPGEVRQVYSDFRTIEGLLVPHSVVISFEGDPMMTTQVVGFDTNPEIAQDIWPRPE